jgi:RNA polymerase sigma factor (sigma-70 family)
MTPFRDRPIKWDENHENGRYKNEGGYKFDIITQTVLKKTEDMPKYFLADTPEEAESIYYRFEKTLNAFAYSYSIATNINKGDLFGEALIGLARAYRDWDPARSDNFIMYAKFVIRDTLNEFVRSNSAIISVPAYIKKANANLKKIKAICEELGIDWKIVIVEQTTPEDVDSICGMFSNGIDKCLDLAKNISLAAKRAKVDYEKFIERIEFIPEDIEYVDQIPPEVHKRDSEMIEAAIVVDKLKEHMTEQELLICEGIMLDKSFDEIGSSLGKSKSWVSGKLKGLKKRIVSMMEEGTL